MLLAAAAAILASCASPGRFAGALPVRLQHPAQLTVARLDPGTAETVAAGRSQVDVKLAYTSLFLRGSQPTTAFVMDGELLRAELGLHYGLTSTLQLDLGIPVGHSAGGFLDHIVEEWHDIINSPESGRDTVMDDRFLVFAATSGETVYGMDRTNAALFDVPIGLTWQFLEPTESMPVALALRGAVELPTGDTNNGFGNGGLDTSVGLYGNVRLGDLHLTAHAGYTFAHTPDRARAGGIDYRDVGFAGVAVEAPLTRDTVAIVQIDWDQSVLRDLRGVNTEGVHTFLWVGFRTQLSPCWAAEIGFGEDLARELSPDFTGYVGIRYGLPRK